jgi:hypothetical protein
MRTNWLNFLIGTLLTVLASSCDVYDYDQQLVSLSRGEAYRGYELTKVEKDGVRLHSLASGGTGSTFYSREGRPHMGGSHSLGNNESVRVVSVDPAAEKADLEFMWLDWVGPFTLPP